MTGTETFFIKRSYASLVAGNFAFDSKHVRELLEAECLIVYTDTGLGNTFALENISIEPLDENNVRIMFDPLTAVRAQPSSILPADVTESIVKWTMDDVDLPSFNVLNDPSGNNPNSLALNHECRSRFFQYADGLCTLTDLVLTLYTSGIHIVDIDNNVKQRYKYRAAFGHYPKTVFALNKDNGLTENDLPVLADMFVLL